MIFAATVTFLTIGPMSLVIGVLLGVYVVRLGLPVVRMPIVTASMVVALVLPAYVVKRLLVDYW